MNEWEPRTDLSDALKCIQAQSELAEQTSQQLQDARAEIERLEEQYRTARDLLEYRTGQYAAMSEVAGEAEAERDDTRRWAAAWKQSARSWREATDFACDAIEYRANEVDALRAERDDARGEMRRYKMLYYDGADVMLNYMVDNVRLQRALERVRAISNNTPNSYQAEIAAITIATAAILEATE